MKHAALALSLLVLAFMAGVPARAADLTSARRFLVSLYAHYPQGARNAFDPTGADAATVFDPSTIALFAENNRLTPRGDVGAIDSDPICACQDDGGLQPRIGAIQLLSPNRASAVVVLTFAQASPPDVQRLELTLVTVGGQWRIFDIHSKDTPSFRAYLVKANLEARRGH